MNGHEIVWLGIGFVSQALFAARFFVQWIVSEMKRTSHIPPSFWYLSIVGSVGLLGYSVYRKDPVFVFGQAFALLIYVRNIMLLRAEK